MSRTFHLYKISRTGKSIQTERRLVVSGGWREGVRGMRFLFEVIKLFLNWIVVMDAQPCDDTKNHWIVCFKRVDFMICELHLNKAIWKRKTKEKSMLDRSLQSSFSPGAVVWGSSQGLLWASMLLLWRSTPLGENPPCSWRNDSKFCQLPRARADGEGLPVVQWLGIHLPMQGMHVQSLVG